jgi:uncharacterized protein
VSTYSTVATGVFVVYPDAAHQYRWRLFATNGRIIADSGESYVTRGGAHQGMELVKRLAPGARVEDKY